MRTYFNSFLLILFFGFLGCSSDNQVQEETQGETKEPLEYQALTNVSYGDDPDQVYDIYLPENRTLSTKIMILVHGGGWNAGDKSDMNGYRDLFLTQFPEMAIANINYRLADENNSPYPMQLNDISSMVDDLFAKKGDYVISEDIGFVGVSAGGHLSLLWSYAFDVDNNVQMVCSVVGPTNLTDEAYLNADFPELQEILDLYSSNQELLVDASPLFQATTSSPPTILFYGGVDPLVPISQGVDLNNRLEALNVIHEFTLYETEGHGWIGLNLLDTSLKLQLFIETYL